ncbi:MAG: hypothetical protein KAI66_06295 [Lentisphaeria bacterium]|nr:hypothetical protein [Lentisphaeria bacterium]
MDQILNAMVEFKRITPADEQCFFGYYDNPAFSPDGSRHLAHRVPFRERLQAPDDVAELGVANLENGSFDVFAETKAWNFQQGSMLQWFGAEPDTVFHNAAKPGGEYCGVIRNLATGAAREVPMPLANLSRDARLGLSINLDRVFDFRPGYGYCQKRDPWHDQKHSDEDGVWIVDMEKAEAKHVLSMQKIWDAMKHALNGMDAKICINHITFNPSANHFVLLARNFRDENAMPWITTVFVSDLDGNLTTPSLYDGCMASHYWWNDDETLVFFAHGPEGNQLYLANVVTGEQTIIDKDYFPFDGHCSTSSDGRWMLYDSYPRDGYRHLFLYSMEKHQGVTLGVLRDLPGEVTDVRCDLHPRWTRDDTGISFDGTFEGFRAVYTADLREIMASMV